MGETWVCMASGPSLCREDVDYVSGRARVAVANDAWTMAPWADLLLASDARWWQWHGGRVIRGFRGERYTCSRVAANRYGARLVGLDSSEGWSADPERVASGGLTGYRLVNLVGHRRPSRILLLGYDMQHTGGRAHFFGDHPNQWPNGQGLEAGLSAFERMAEMSPVPIINCSRDSALTCFPRADLREVLDGSAVSAG
ncbi:hypothetical protein [Alloalcanivorax xenomutans]